MSASPALSANQLRRRRRKDTRVQQHKARCDERKLVNRVLDALARDDDYPRLHAHPSTHLPSSHAFDHLSHRLNGCTTTTVSSKGATWRVVR